MVDNGGGGGGGGGGVVVVGDTKDDTGGANMRYALHVFSYPVRTDKGDHAHYLIKWYLQNNLHLNI